MEDAIIQRAQLGDQAAFRQLVEAYADVAWRTARVLLADREAAQDALQEAWLDAWRGLPRFQRGRLFRPWLLTLVANRCRMAARHKRVSTVTLDDTELEGLVDAEDVLGQIVRGESDAELRAALATLPPEQQRVLELRYFADLELSEIALVSNIPVGTVKSRLHRALEHLRIHLLPERIVRSGAGQKEEHQ